MRTAELAPWVATAPWRVERVRRESHDVVTLALAPARPFTFDPGQFSMLHLAGIGEVPISISGAADGLVLHTIRDVGAVTHALCELMPGQHVLVRGPYGTAWPVPAAFGGDLVLVAGGIGLPPLRPAMYAALASREQFGRIVLLYGARTPADLLFTDELATWRARFDLTVEVIVDAATPAHASPSPGPASSADAPAQAPAGTWPAWRGNVGVVPDLIARAGPYDPGHTTVFTVGPEIMMRFAVRALLREGVAEDRIYLSMERNMQCAAALCGHCQFGPYLICRDGPVLSYRRLARWLGMREV